MLLVTILVWGGDVPIEKAQQELRGITQTRQSLKEEEKERKENKKQKLRRELHNKVGMEENENEGGGGGEKNGWLVGQG